MSPGASTAPAKPGAPPTTSTVKIDGEEYTLSASRITRLATRVFPYVSEMTDFRQVQRGDKSFTTISSLFSPPSTSTSASPATASTDVYRALGGAMLMKARKDGKLVTSRDDTRIIVKTGINATNDSAPNITDLGIVFNADGSQVRFVYKGGKTIASSDKADLEFIATLFVTYVMTAQQMIDEKISVQRAVRSQTRVGSSDLPDALATSTPQDTDGITNERVFGREFARRAQLAPEASALQSLREAGGEARVKSALKALAAYGNEASTPAVFRTMSATCAPGTVPITDRASGAQIIAAFADVPAFTRNAKGELCISSLLDEGAAKFAVSENKAVRDARERKERQYDSRQRAALTEMLSGLQAHLTGALKEEEAEEEEEGSDDEVGAQAGAGRGSDDDDEEVEEEVEEEEEEDEADQDEEDDDVDVEEDEDEDFDDDDA